MGEESVYRDPAGAECSMVIVNKDRTAEAIASGRCASFHIYFIFK